MVESAVTNNAAPGLTKKTKGQAYRHKGHSESILDHSQLEMTRLRFCIRVWQSLTSRVTKDDI
eukprot:scaffold155660_cov58-Attheya_sp.AAC.8